MPRVRLIQSPAAFLLNDEDDDPQVQETKRETRNALEDIPVAFISDLDRPAMQAGENYMVWLQAAGMLPVDAGNISLTENWIAEASARSELSIYFSADSDRLLRAADLAKATARERGLAAPLVLVGPFMDDAAAELDRFYGSADGFVIQSRPFEEPEIEAEMLRRAASCMGERMMLERGTWKQAPIVCLRGRPDALAMVAASVCEYVLLDEPPTRGAVPGGRLVVMSDAETRPWWAADVAAVGPNVLRYRVWMADPRAGKRGVVR
jgi:hypothetical protein